MGALPEVQVWARAPGDVLAGEWDKLWRVLIQKNGGRPIHIDLKWTETPMFSRTLFAD